MQKNKTAGALRPGQGATSSSSSLDIVAYKQLLRFVSSARKQRNKDAGEYGLEKLTSHYKRKAHGLQLAQDLFHDGTRLGFKRRHKLVLTSDDTTLGLADDDSYADDTSVGALNACVLVIQNALVCLPANQQLALSLRIVGEQEECVIKQLLGVGLRQYRKLAERATTTLNSNPITKRVYLLVIAAFNGPHGQHLVAKLKEVFNDVLAIGK